jgi:hypothetical protein
MVIAIVLLICYNNVYFTSATFVATDQPVLVLKVATLLHLLQMNNLKLNARNLDRLGWQPVYYSQ